MPGTLGPAIVARDKFAQQVSKNPSGCRSLYHSASHGGSSDVEQTSALLLPVIHLSTTGRTPGMVVVYHNESGLTSFL